MQRRAFLLGTVAITTLASCGVWGVDYNDQAAQQASQWRVQELNIVASPDLSVSMEDSLNPKADIVWWSNLPADPAQRLASRRSEVRRILTQAISPVTAQLNGPIPVRVDVNLLRFHGLTPTAYRTLEVSGVHNVFFEITVYSIATGEVLARTEVHADTPGLGDEERRRQNARGNDDTARVTATIRRAVAGWFGLIADSRQSFSRLGA